MRHKLCRSFHPWCPGVKNRCLCHNVTQYSRQHAGFWWTPFVAYLATGHPRQKSVQREGGCGRTSKKQNPKNWKRKSCIPWNWSWKGKWLETCSLDGDSGHGGTLQGISTHEMTKATSLELAPQCIFPWQTSCRQLPHTCTHHARPPLPFIPKCHHRYNTPLPLAFTPCYTEFQPHRFTLMTAILLQRRSLRHLCQHSH